MKKKLFLILVIFLSCKNRKEEKVLKINTIKKLVEPKKSIIRNLKVDTSFVFGIWAYDINEPHADFWLTKDSYYIIDFDGKADRKFILDKNKLTIFLDDEYFSGKILSADKDSLKIKWNDSEIVTKYVRFDE